MKINPILSHIALAAVGVAIGVAAAFWHFGNEWNTWWVTYNMSPLMKEQTFALKHLKGGEHAKLQEILDETVWRNMAVAAELKSRGKLWPEDAKTSYEYHCQGAKANEPSSAAASAPTKGVVCAVLLGKQ